MGLPRAGVVYAGRVDADPLPSSSPFLRLFLFVERLPGFWRGGLGGEGRVVGANERGSVGARRDRRVRCHSYSTELAPIEPRTAQNSNKEKEDPGCWRNGTACRRSNRPRAPAPQIPSSSSSRTRPRPSLQVVWRALLEWSTQRPLSSPPSSLSPSPFSPLPHSSPPLLPNPLSLPPLPNLLSPPISLYLSFSPPPLSSPPCLFSPTPPPPPSLPLSMGDGKGGGGGGRGLALSTRLRQRRANDLGWGRRERQRMDCGRSTCLLDCACTCALLWQSPRWGSSPLSWWKSGKGWSCSTGLWKGGRKKMSYL